MATANEFKLELLGQNKTHFSMSRTTKYPIYIDNSMFKFPCLAIETDFIKYIFGKYDVSSAEFAQFLKSLRFWKILNMRQSFWDKSPKHLEILLKYLINYLSNTTVDIIDEIFNIIFSEFNERMLYLLHSREFVDLVNAQLIKFNYKFNYDDGKLKLSNGKNSYCKVIIGHIQLQYFDITKMIIDYSCGEIKILHLSDGKYNEFTSKYREISAADGEKMRTQKERSIKTLTNDLSELIKIEKIDQMEILQKLISPELKIDSPKDTYIVEYEYIEDASANAQSANTQSANTQSANIQSANTQSINIDPTMPNMFFIKHETYYIYINDPNFSIAVDIEVEFLKLFINSDYAQNTNLRYKSNITGKESMWNNEKSILLLPKLLKNRETPLKLSDYINLLFKNKSSDFDNNFKKLIYLLRSDDFMELIETEKSNDYKIKVKKDIFYISGDNISQASSFDMRDKSYFKYPELVYHALLECFTANSVIHTLSKNSADQLLLNYEAQKSVDNKLLIDNKITRLNELFEHMSAAEKLNAIMNIFQK
jgi:hypothetical protein